MAPLLSEISFPMKLLCAKFLLEFKVLSPLAERVQSEKRDKRELFTRMGESDTVKSVQSYLRSAPFACVTLHRFFAGQQNCFVHR